MPVYAPFPQLSPPPPDWDCTKTTPPPSKSHYLGSWYSTPAAAACPPGTSPAADAGQQGGCSWARRASQHFVLGRDLHALGFNTSGAADYPELVHNRQVLQKAFKRLTKTSQTRMRPAPRHLTLERRSLYSGTFSTHTLALARGERLAS